MTEVVPRDTSFMVYRFGKFELLPEAGQLRKSGAPIHLQPQPLRVLTLLASRAGELVTREEIRAALWGHETFVDYEQGVNTAIRQIRRAVGPQIIETVPRRGYRFIAPLEHTLSSPTYFFAALGALALGTTLYAKWRRRRCQ